MNESTKKQLCVMERKIKSIIQKMKIKRGMEEEERKNQKLWLLIGDYFNHRLSRLEENFKIIESIKLW